MEELLTTAEVAAALGVDRSTVIRMVPGGITPVGKLPGKTGAWLFNPSVIEDSKGSGDAA